MANARGTDTAKTPGDHVTELRELVVGYAKQETLDPIINLKHTIGFGLGGAACVGFGCALLLLGLLRGLQTIDVFNDPASVYGGAWSWVPYVITAVVAAAMIGLAVWGIVRKTGERKA